MKNTHITLYCLPFAGGSSYSYRSLQAHFAPFIQMKPIELRGRGKRFKEPLLTDLSALAEDILAQLIISPLTPYAIYGHSMGALLGYVLTKRILAHRLPAPIHLFFSGYRAPSIIKHEAKHALPKPEFINILREMGGCPREVLENEELMDFFEPILRADFKAIETYTYQPTAPFHVPITLLLGTEEKINEPEITAWQRETHHPIIVNKFVGQHFFIFDHPAAIGQLVSDSLAKHRHHPIDYQTIYQRAS